MASLAAVALAGTGEVGSLQLPGALGVLAGVILGLAPQIPATTLSQANRATRLSGEMMPAARSE